MTAAVHEAKDCSGTHTQNSVLSSSKFTESHALGTNVDKSIPTYPRWKSGSRCSLTDNRSPSNGQRPPAHRGGHQGFCLKLDFSRGSVFNSHGLGGWALEVPFRGNPEGDAVQSWVPETCAAWTSE